MKRVTERERKELEAWRQPGENREFESERSEALATAELIERTLGAPPNTYVQFDLTHGADSQSEAWRLIQRLCHHWHLFVLRNFLPIDLADDGKQVWALDDVGAFFARHRRLPT